MMCQLEWIVQFDSCELPSKERNTIPLPGAFEYHSTILSNNSTMVQSSKTLHLWIRLTLYKRIFLSIGYVRDHNWIILQSFVLVLSVLEWRKFFLLSASELVVSEVSAFLKFLRFWTFEDCSFWVNCIWSFLLLNTKFLRSYWCSFWCRSELLSWASLHLFLVLLMNF